MNDIEQYAKLKSLRDDLDARLKELAERIKLALPEGKHVSGDYEVTVQVKDLTKLDLDATHDLANRKGWVWQDYCTPVPDPALIEQAYLNGEITDTDIRGLRKPKYTTALIVKRVDA
jgi:hypothetical protein